MSASDDVNLTQSEVAAQFYYAGEQDSINLGTLLESLMGFSLALEEIHRYYNPDKKLDIRVKALSPGSFGVNLTVLVQNLTDALKVLMNSPVTATASGLIQTLITILQFIQSKKKTTDPPPSITHINIDTIIVKVEDIEALAQNERLKKGISQAFSAIENEEAITAFKIKDENGNDVYVTEREDFGLLASQSSEDNIRTRTLRERTSLSIVKPSFHHDLKWDVDYHGRRAYVTIRDEDFLKRAGQREVSFRIGDQLDADIVVEQEWVPAQDAYKDRLLVVEKVHGLSVGPQLPLPHEQSDEPDNPSTE